MGIAWRTGGVACSAFGGAPCGRAAGTGCVFGFWLGSWTARFCGCATRCAKVGAGPDRTVGVTGWTCFVLICWTCMRACDGFWRAAWARNVWSCAGATGVPGCCCRACCFAANGTGRGGGVSLATTGRFKTAAGGAAALRLLLFARTLSLCGTTLGAAPIT